MILLDYIICNVGLLLCFVWIDDIIEFKLKIFCLNLFLGVSFFTNPNLPEPTQSLIGWVDF